jgi:AcrR family transcriptional regulator
VAGPQPVREKLLSVAMQQFAAVGYEATTMRGVASKAGITLPTVYHYFGDKANLYLEACVACFAPRAERGLAAYRQSDESEEQRVLTFFIDLARDFLEDENFFKLMHREMIAQSHEGIRELTERCWKHSFAALCAAFRTLLPAKQDAVTTAFTSFALTFGLVEFRRKAPFLSPGLTQHYSAEGIAVLVLSTTVPSIPWRDFCKPEPLAVRA